MPAFTLNSIAVIVVTYNSSAIIGELLASVRSGEPSPVFVRVVDNASTDWAKTEKVVAEFGAEFQRLPSNLGYGGAVNAAARSVPYEKTAFLIANADITLAPGALTRLSDTLSRDPNAAAIGPRILNPDGSTYPSARAQPSLRVGLGHALLADVWPSNPWSRKYHGDPPRPGESVRAVGWLSGACLLVDRAKFDRIGGFDDRFFMYFEDVDLGRRFGKHGFVNVYDPMAVITHLGAHSTRARSKDMTTAHHVSAYRFLSKKYDGVVLAPLRAILRIGLYLRLQVKLRNGAR
jgi:N-acetylglucosaminyl-diphospho-decaprenol L-rhamnosyltransferase